MKNTAGFSQVACFGAFKADLRAGELLKNGRRIRLQEQPLQILAMLLEHPGKIVTREELHQKLWPADTFVDFDHGLNNAINRLREALGDSADSSRFIETLSRRGYRFIAAVHNGDPATAQTSVVSNSKLAAPAERVAQTGEFTSAVRRPTSIPWISVTAFAVVLGLLLGFNVRDVRNRLLGKPSLPTIHSIAVLPFDNLTGDASQEYFVDGMTDALTTELAQVKALRVISRTSAMQYKGAKRPLKEIARELNVDAVVEGTVRRSGGQVWITAQLIEAATDQHLWARAYERDLSNVPALESDAARDIVQEIRVQVTPQEKSRLKSNRKVNSAANEAYLKGSYFANKRTEQGMVKSIHYFEKAAQEDPGYALAFSGLADSYVLLGFFGIFPSKEAYPKAESAAVKALEMDDTIAQAHESMAEAKLWFDWDWPGAEREFKRAIELNPGYAIAHQHYGDYLSAMGHLDESIAEAKRALELDPLSLPMNTHLGFMFYLARQYDQAIEQYQKTLELDPNHARALRDLSMAYAQKGMYKEAVLEGKRAIDRSEASPSMLAILGYTYAASRNKAKTREVLLQLEQLSKRRYVSPFYLALVHVGLGQKNEAFAWLEKCYEERSSQLVWLNVNPAFDRLRSDARFTELVRRVGLPENGSRK
jgi:TolB-like protein/DNA-binding winged helix-turn-helix (wHTH) protein/Tfp pilus assembly protein PilF